MSYSMNRTATKPKMWIGDDGEMEYEKPFCPPPPKLEVVEPVLVDGLPIFKGSYASRTINTVAAALKMPPEKLKGKSRVRKYVEARAIVARILRNRNRSLYSSTVVGRLLGGRDYSTILHLEYNWDVYCKRNPALPKVKERVLEALGVEQ